MSKRIVRRLAGRHLSSGVELNGYFIHKSSNLPFGTSLFADLTRLTSKSDIRRIFDIGANKGHWAKMASHVYPDAEIHCFEPLAELNSDTNRNSNVRIINKAVSDETGSSVFYTYDTSEYSGFSENTDSPSEFVSKRTVETITVDHYLENVGGALPDVLKVDVEGFELNVLRGAQETIAESKNLFIISEFRTGNGQLEELLEFIYRNDLKVISFYNGHVDRKSGLKFGDILFAKLSP